MKKNILFSGALCMLLLAFVSCSNEGEVQNPTDEISQITMTAPDFGYLTTRTDFDINENGAAFKWGENDTVGIFPNEGSQVYFPMSSGAGASSASFTGGGWALKSSASYAAYYPFVGDMYLDKTKIPVSYVGQTQTGNGSTAHLGAYDFMASAATTAENGGVNFIFKHLGCLVQLTITVPEPATLNKVVLTSSSDFTQTGTIDLTAMKPVVTTETESNSIELELSGITTTEANESVIVYFMIAPIDLSGENLTISLHSADEIIRETEIIGKNFEAGMAYRLDVEMEESEELPTIGFGFENGYEWVDLGLPSGLKWATCNVGATMPEGYGDYFAWGETSPKNNCDLSTYKYCNGSETSLTKYNTSSDYGMVDNKITLDFIDDAARVNWGGTWRIPTIAEQRELRDNCTYTWITQNGVYGCKLVSKINGNSIFLPEAGMQLGTRIDFGVTFYWSSSLYHDESLSACCMALVKASDSLRLSSIYRPCGQPVRAVCGDITVPQIFTIIFDANGGIGTMDEQSFVAGVFQHLATNAFTRSGYFFTGWNTAPDGSGTSYTDGQELNSLTRDMTLYAQWFTPTYVDLGLSVKWATCNVGATTPEGYGDYFAWGETKPKSNYNWLTYGYCKGDYDTMTKYCTNNSFGTVDNKTTLDLADDAARANWGDTWRMPTKEEQRELIDNCTWTWITQNGVNGYKVISKINGNSIFLPAAGSRDGTSVGNVGSFGGYWSSSLNYVDDSNYAWYLFFASGTVYMSDRSRYYGHHVRAVCP